MPKTNKNKQKKQTQKILSYQSYPIHIVQTECLSQYLTQTVRASLLKKWKLFTVLYHDWSMSNLWEIELYVSSIPFSSDTF